MAKATLDAKVTLELSFEEATTLKDVLNSVAGDPADTRRKHTDAIEAALGIAGVQGSDNQDLSGCVEFSK